MARIRTIKPEMASDVKLARLSRDSRYTFVLIISQADDYGLLLGNPRQLLGTLYPHDEDVSVPLLGGWLAELVRAKLVRWRETKDGAPVLEVVNWQRHQKVDKPAKPFLLERLLPLDAVHSVEALPILARPSRDPREDVAEPSRSDLGPRTLDLGPTTKDLLPPPSASGGEEAADTEPCLTLVTTPPTDAPRSRRKAPPKGERGEGAPSVCLDPSEAASEAPKPKARKAGGAPWLGAIRRAHEARNGPGSFTPVLANRFLRSWAGIVAAVGEEAAAKTWYHAQRPTNPDLKFVTPERVAAAYAQHDPDRLVAV